MTNFLIEYNPYLVKCVFKKNGKELSSRTKIGSKSDQRLQVLLGESINWKGLPEEIAIACDDDEVKIHFKGRRIDFDDLQYSFGLYGGNVKFTFEFEETKNDSDIISFLDDIFKEIKEKNRPEFNVPNTDGKSIFESYEEVKNGIFEVSVIATMSSGKSTLINSLLHTELLPSENKACTATICKILDNDNMDTFKAECYGADNEQVVYPCKEVTVGDITEYNSDDKVVYINIEGPIPGIPSDKIRLCLIDTPGPNNSRNENHGILTKSIIQRTNAVVLYVMNATQIGIKDDEQLLKDISNEMKRAGKQSRDRFIFVINKCDALDEEKGETVDKLMDDVRDYLKQFDIEDPTLIPTSARLALLIRKSRSGNKLSTMEKGFLSCTKDYVQSDLLHFEKYATLTPTVKEKLQEQVNQYHNDKDNWDLEALVRSGIPAVEETICEYIDKYAYPIKIKDAIKDIVSILDELDMKAKFDREIADDSDKLAKVREQIKEAHEKHKESESEYNYFKTQIDNLSLDENYMNEKQLAVENHLQKMTKKYDGKESVDQAEANEMIESFKKALLEYQEKYREELYSEINEKIYNQCQTILENYKSTIKKILSSVSIEDYEFSRIQRIGELTIDNIENIKTKYKQERFKSYTTKEKNPAREGLGFFKFWEPWKIEVEKKKLDGYDVDVKKVIVDMMTPFSSGMQSNISKMFVKAKDQITDYKDFFKDNLDKLKEEIQNVLIEIDDATKDQEDIQRRVASNQELSEWVFHMEEEIRQVLQF